MVTTSKKSTLLEQQRRGLRCRPEAPLPSHNAMMLSSQVTISVSLPSNLPGEWFHPPLEIPPRTRGARVLECAPPCSLAIRKDFHSGSTNKIASSILKMSSTSIPKQATSFVEHVPFSFKLSRMHHFHVIS